MAATEQAGYAQYTIVLSKSTDMRTEDNHGAEVAGTVGFQGEELYQALLQDWICPVNVT